MADLQERLKSVIEELENKIENKDTLEFVKTQIYNLSLIFLDEIERVSEVNVKKMDALAEKYKEINNKVDNIEESVKNIEKDIYMQEDEEDEFDLEIVCPYCNNAFIADFSDELKDEITCPECNNIIELDWNKEEHDCGGCCDCHGEENGECNGNCKNDNDDDDM